MSMSAFHAKIIKFFVSWEPCEIPKWFHSWGSAPPYPMMSTFTEYVNVRTFQYKIMSSGGFLQSDGDSVKVYRRLRREK
jgi:hypothetical protein